MKKLFKFKKRLVPKFNLNKGIFNAKHSTLAALVLLVVGIGVFNILSKGKAQTTSNYNVYVADNWGGALRILNSSDNTFSTAQAGGPNQMVFSHDGKYLYIAAKDSRASEFQVLDVATKKVIKSIALQGANNVAEGTGIAITPDDKYVYLAGTGGVSVIQTSDNTVVKTININSAQGVAINPNNQYVYATSYDNSHTFAKFSIISIASNSITTTIDLKSSLSLDGSRPNMVQPNGIAVTPDGKYAYVADTNHDAVAVIDLSTNRIKTVLHTDHENSGIIAITPDGQYAYVPEYYGSETKSYLRVIRLSDNAQIKTIGLSGGIILLGIAITPDSQYVYVTNNDGDYNDAKSLLVVSTATNSLVNKISIGVTGGIGVMLYGVAIAPSSSTSPATTYSITKTSEIVGKTGNTAQPGDTIKYTIKYKGGVVAPPTPVVLAGFSWPIDIDISPNGSFAYVADLGNNTVAKIDTRTNTIIKKITGIVGKNSPWRIAISPNGTFAYISNLGADTISRINTSTDTITRTISATNPGEIAISPDGSFAYIIYSNDTGTSGGIYRINTSTDTITKTIIGFSGGPSSVSISPDGSFAYVTGANSYVYRVSTSTDTIIKTISGFNRPSSVSISPDGSFAYLIDYKVGSATQGIVSRINTSTDTVTKTITDDQSPLSLAISPNGKFAYISNNSPDTISRIDISTDTIDQTISGFGTAGNLDISPDGSFAYSAGSYLGIVYRINN